MIEIILLSGLHAGRLFSFPFAPTEINFVPDEEDSNKRRPASENDSPTGCDPESPRVKLTYDPRYGSDGSIDRDSDGRLVYVLRQA